MAADTKKYENTTLNSILPLRFTYYMLASKNLRSLNESYLNSKPKYTSERGESQLSFVFFAVKIG